MFDGPGSRASGLVLLDKGQFLSGVIVPFQDTTAACAYAAVGNAMHLLEYADEALESL